MTDKLTYNCTNGIGEITLNQPAKRNAISAAMWQAFPLAISRAEKDASCNVIVIQGAGDNFAAGADISEFEDTYKTRDSASDYTQTMFAALTAINECAKPTISAIRGSCVGGGCSIALSCDFRFAEIGARFAITPSKLGLVYSICDTRRLVQTVGVASTKDLLYTGRLIESEEALAIGLIDRLWDSDCFEKNLRAYIALMDDVSPWSIRATKKMLQFINDGATDENHDAFALMLDSFESSDFKEGYKAFLAKRKPNFKG